MPRFFDKKATPTSQTIGELTMKVSVDSAEIQEYLKQMLADAEAEIAAYKLDAERFIWLRDYSPLKEGEDREARAAELDALCDEGLAVLKAASDPTPDAAS